jgi:hypothetical protein
MALSKARFPLLLFPSKLFILLFLFFYAFAPVESIPPGALPPKVMTILLESGIKIMTKQEFYQTLQNLDDSTISELLQTVPNSLSLLLETGDFSQIKVKARRMLQKGKSRQLLLTSDRQGRTVLHIAVENGSDTLVEEILQNPETDINAKDFKGQTPICESLSTFFVF